MRFSLLYELTNPKPWNERSESDVWHEAIEQVALADKLGFETAWAVEHHFLEELSVCSAPEIFLSACAMKTERIRLGHGVVLLPSPFNRPVRVAERIAALDIISDGRVEFGTGRASSLIELDGFRVEPEHTRGMWEEAVEMIPRMWESDRFSHEGQYFSVPERNVIPKPVQKPHPPIWMACSQAESFEIAAGKGLGVLCFTSDEPEQLQERLSRYRELVADARPVGAFVNNRIAGFTPMYCGESMEEAVEVGATGAAWYQTSFISKIKAGWRGREVKSYEYAREAAEKVPEDVVWDIDRYKKRGMGKGGWCIGDPDEVAAQAQRYVENGFDDLLFIVQTGKIPHEKIMASLERFAAEVMPRFEN